MKKFFQKLRKSEKGATMVEYGLMLALIAAVCIGTVIALGTAADGTFQDVSTAITTKQPPPAQ